MKTYTATLLAAGLGVLVLTGATCDKNGAGPETKPTADAAPAPAAPAKDAGVAPATGTGAAALEGIPGMDFSELPAPAKKELSAVFSDEFCYCGCPHTLGQCLKVHPTCQHARRMAVLAAGEAADGLPSTEIIVTLGRYYESFRERHPFKPDSRMCVGAKDAKVTLLEFSDFECPFCGAARPLLEDFAKKNPDVRLCYAPFPLASHPHSQLTAQAALFAREKGKFWEMHDALFEHQTELSREKILELAKGIGLNADELAKAIDAGQFLDEVRAFKEAGKEAGIDHTPTVYVNGRELMLGLSSEALKHTVVDELEWQSNGGAWAKD